MPSPRDLEFGGIFYVTGVATLCGSETDQEVERRSGGERVVMLEQPKYGTQMIKTGGWDVDDLREHFKANLAKLLEPVGLMKNPYPFYDGVKPRAK